MLRLQNISKHFDGIAAVNNVSLIVDQKEIVCITGGNGAGKTTLFNLITGFEKVDDGFIFFKDNNITNVPPSRRAQKGISRLFQTPRIFNHLTVIENVLAAATHHPGERIENYFVFKFKEIIKEERQNYQKALGLLDFCDLRQYEKEFAANLSVGQKKLLSLSMLLMNNAELLLFDEIYANINDIMINKINSLVSDLAKQGKAFIIIEHRIKQIRNISNRILVMDQGFIKSEMN